MQDKQIMCKSSYSYYTAFLEKDLTRNIVSRQNSYRLQIYVQHWLYQVSQHEETQDSKIVEYG